MFTKCLALQHVLESTITINGRITVQQEQPDFAAGHCGFEHFTALKLLNACVLDCLGKGLLALLANAVWLSQSLTPVPLTSGENEHQQGL